MRLGILGKKLGMTQLFTSNEVIPVTVVEAGPCPILQKKTTESDKYNAIQLGFGDKRAKNCNKPVLGHFAKTNSTPKRFIKEIRLPDDQQNTFKEGEFVKIDMFQEGEHIDVVGTSKGKGFQGVMKRHNFKGFENSHGNHEYFRHGGSIGCRLTPGRTFPGMRMGGQMGNVRCTVQNLTVFRIDAEKNLLFIKGAVPGPTNGFVMVYKSKRK